MSKHLLCIDDNYIDLAIIKNLQAKSKAFKDVSYSMNAESAINFIKDNLQNDEALPDVIILDLYMNTYSGWEFLDAYQHIFPLLKKHIEIHILSFSILPQDISRSKKYSYVKSYCIKPVTPEAFQRL